MKLLKGKRLKSSDLCCWHPEINQARGLGALLGAHGQHQLRPAGKGGLGR
jgi:hypothetical protein